MEFKVFSTNQNSQYPSEFTNDILFEYEYEGIEENQYLDIVGSMNTEKLHFFLIDEDENTIAASLTLEIVDPEYTRGMEYNKWVSNVSVHNDYRNLGLSRVIIKKFFEYCSENGINHIRQSSYTPAGMKKSMHIFIQYAEKFPNVKFYDEKKEF
ncbi:hypothetical protein PBI_SCTP2_308 [Salicola phage SCTP-2]|nr:hypothetical protein PBI_SCTP2_308 [Salicola phage SCTP-2]